MELFSELKELWYLGVAKDGRHWPNSLMPAGIRGPPRNPYNIGQLCNTLT
jgi:hypothetical protein